MFTGEEILEDDEFAVTATEQQVIDCIGGYIVRRLFKQGKLSCEGCRDSLVSTNQGIFVQEKQHDGAELLSSSSASLAAFLLSAEGTFRASMSVKDFSHGDEIGKSLREQIGRKAPSLACCHPTDAASCIIGLFLRVRLHHHCKLFNHTISAVRKQKAKEKKLKKMNVVIAKKKNK